MVTRLSQLTRSAGTLLWLPLPCEGTVGTGAMSATCGAPRAVLRTTRARGASRAGILTALATLASERSSYGVFLLRGRIVDEIFSHGEGSAHGIRQCDDEQELDWFFRNSGLPGRVFLAAGAEGPEQGES